MKIFVILALCMAGAYTLEFMNADEVQLVQSTWKEVKFNEVEILYNIFSLYPDIQAKFPAFAGKNLDEVKSTQSFALHASRIVQFMSNIITLIGSPDNRGAIEYLLKELAHVHVERQATTALFGEFKLGFLDYLSKHMTWGDNVKAAWEHAIDNVYEIIFANLH
jgi:hypothetical protein